MFYKCWLYKIVNVWVPIIYDRHNIPSDLKPSIKLRVITLYNNIIIIQYEEFGWNAFSEKTVNIPNIFIIYWVFLQLSTSPLG